MSSSLAYLFYWNSINFIRTYQTSYQFYLIPIQKVQSVQLNFLWEFFILHRLYYIWLCSNLISLVSLFLYVSVSQLSISVSLCSTAHLLLLLCMTTTIHVHIAFHIRYFIAINIYDDSVEAWLPYYVNAIKSLQFISYNWTDFENTLFSYPIQKDLFILTLVRVLCEVSWSPVDSWVKWVHL